MLDLVLAAIIVSIFAFLIILLIKYVLNPMFFPDKLPKHLIDKFLKNNNLKLINWSVLEQNENPFNHKKIIEFNFLSINLFKYYRLNCKNKINETLTIYVKHIKDSSWINKEKIETIIKKNEN